MTDAKVAVVGAGSIGVAWAIVFARAGHRVSVYDVDPARRQAVGTEVLSRLDQLAGFGLLTESPATVLARISVSDRLALAVEDAAFVQESVLESLDIKRELFEELDVLAAPDAVLASSTSMIPATRFAADLPGRSRCLVVHPGNPPYLIPVVELVPAPFTDAAVVATTGELLAAAGMVPVLVHLEPEGFVFNRLQGAVLREAYCLVRDGVASPADIDRVVSSGLGRRWAVLGPFATAQLNTRGGIRRHAEVMGPAYARMGAERGQDDRWTDDLVATVAADVDEHLPPERWADQVVRRDRALMHLEQARRAAPELFDLSADDLSTDGPTPDPW